MADCNTEQENRQADDNPTVKEKKNCTDVSTLKQPVSLLIYKQPHHTPSIVFRLKHSETTCIIINS